MLPHQILPYYPTYSDLDQITQSKNFRHLYLYVDIKNILQGIYLSNIAEQLVQESQGPLVSSSVFSSLMSFVSFHKNYAFKRDLDLNIIFFMESGQSYYHKNILPSYKSERGISHFANLTTEQMLDFFRILRKNLELSEFIFSKLYNISFIRLQNLEADFVPYYIIKYLLEPQLDTVHIIYSTDKDMYQILTIPDHEIYQFHRTARNKKIIDKSQVLNLLLSTNSDINIQYIPLAHAIIGDTSDGVPGIKGIGGSRCSKVLSELIPLLNNIDMDLLSYRASRNEILFSEINLNDNLINKLNKNTVKVLKEETTNRVISRNLKLVSFDTIIKTLQNLSSGIPKLEFIENQFQSLHINILNKDKLSNSLNELNIDVEDGVLDTLFVGNPII